MTFNFPLGLNPMGVVQYATHDEFVGEDLSSTWQNTL